MTVGPHLALTWQGVYGSVGAPLERFQFSMKADIDNSLSVTVTAADKTAILDRMVSLWQSLKPLYHSQVCLSAVDVRRKTNGGIQPKDTSGQYIDAFRRDVNLPGLSTSGARYSPGTALAVSLHTLRAGATGKGRFFLPAPGINLDVDYRLFPADVDSIEGTIATWISGWNTFASTSSPANAISVMSTKGFASTVTGVSVGRVLDTMQSRRRSILEGRTITPVT